MDWLHFIGREYYDRRSFNREAQDYGVSRRIDVRLMKQFNFGDRVFCFMRDGKSSICFGYFVVTAVLGALGSEIRNELESEGKIKAHSSGTFDTISRGCGSYCLGASYTVDASIPEIAEKMEKHGTKSVMLGGSFTPFTQDSVIRSAIPFQRGFRRFDWDDFRCDYERQLHEGRKLPKVWRSGIVAKSEIDWVVTNGGEIKEVVGYQRREEIKPDMGLFGLS